MDRPAPGLWLPRASRTWAEATGAAETAILVASWRSAAAAGSRRRRRLDALRPNEPDLGAMGPAGPLPSAEERRETNENGLPKEAILDLGCGDRI